MGQRSQRHLREFAEADSSGRPGPDPLASVAGAIVTKPHAEVGDPAVVSFSGIWNHEYGLEQAYDTSFTSFAVGWATHITAIGIIPAIDQWVADINGVGAFFQFAATRVGTTVEIAPIGANTFVDLSMLKLVKWQARDFIVNGDNSVTPALASDSVPVEIKCRGTMFQTEGTEFVYRIDGGSPQTISDDPADVPPIQATAREYMRDWIVTTGISDRPDIEVVFEGDNLLVFSQVQGTELRLVRFKVGTDIYYSDT